MRKLLLFSLIGILLLSIAAAIVYETNFTFEGLLENGDEIIGDELNQVSVIGFVCSNEQCSEVEGRLWDNILNTGNDNKIVLQYPTKLISDYGYGVYFFKEGYIPYEVLADWHGNGKAGEYDNYLYKKKGCYSNVADLQVTGSAEIGKVLSINVDIFSPIGHAGPLDYVPEELKEHYQVDVDVFLEITKNNEIVEEYTKEVSIEYSGKKQVSFDWTAQETGEYEIRVYTIIDDAKCIENLEKEQTQKIIINGDDKKPVVNIMFPENITYNNFVKKIQYEAVDDNLDSCWYSLSNGENVSVTCNEEISGIISSTGSNRWSVYAMDKQGNVGFDRVVFSVDIEEPACCDDEDCGIDKFIGDKYCKNNNVYKDFIEFTCNNPDTPEAFCSNDTFPVLVEECEFGCSNGACLQQCQKDEDCGEEELINKYCVLENVYGNYSVPKCVGGVCETIYEQRLIEECEFGCSNGECITPEIACCDDEDCGIDKFIGDKYCKNNNVYQDFIEFTCNNPDTPEAFCSNITTPKLVEECDDYCENGVCKDGDDDDGDDDDDVFDFERGGTRLNKTEEYICLGDYNCEKFIPKGMQSIRLNNVDKIDLNNVTANQEFKENAELDLSLPLIILIALIVILVILLVFVFSKR